MRFQPGQQIDAYEIVEDLGQGAYAETYRARDTRNGATVVLKCPNPQLFADPALFNRYQREVEIAKQLNHPGVQRSVDVGDSRTEPYLVLEYVDGENLRSRLRAEGGRVSVEQAVDWGIQLARALDYLHRHEIIHRDLKPENVLVAADGTLKIADFGTALIKGARRLTWRHLSESLGTPDYMSPEQIQGERGDARSDLYSWGVMMYEMLTGRVPFEGDNWMAVMQGHLQRTPKPIRRLRPEVPEALEAVVMTAMRRYPDHRYQSATDLLADLDRIRAHTSAAPSAATAAGPNGLGVPVPASPPSPSAAPSAPTDPYANAWPTTTWSPSPTTAAGAFRMQDLNPLTHNRAPEAPMGGMAASGSAQRLWVYIGLIAAGFVAAVAVVITLTVVLR